MDFVEVFENNAAPNNSMDVRAKQRLCYERRPLLFGGLGGGFASRHLSRYVALGFDRRFMIVKLKHFFIIALLLLATLAQSSFAQTNLQIEAAEKLNKVGSDFFLERNYEKALESFLKELPLRRAAKDTLGEAWALNQIGESYSSLRKWQEALNYYSQALPLFRQVKNSHGEARTLHALSGVSAALKNYCQSLKYLEEVLPIVQASEDRQWEGMILGDIASTYFELREDAKAFEYFNKRLAYEQTRKNEVGEAEAFWSLGTANEARGNKPKAIESYQRALSINLKISRTMQSDYLTEQIKQLREAIERLQK